MCRCRNGDSDSKLAEVERELRCKTDSVSGEMLYKSHYKDNLVPQFQTVMVYERRLRTESMLDVFFFALTPSSGVTFH